MIKVRLNYHEVDKIVSLEAVVLIIKYQKCFKPRIGVNVLDF